MTSLKLLSMAYDKAVLLILDDIVVDKKQEILENYFIRGRKIGLGITICYLSQSYYDIPKLIRKNLSYLIILKRRARGSLR